MNATNYRASCLQFYSIDLGVQDEDCLYLNIFSPDTNQNGTKYPVMIWIHGGGFLFGNGQWRSFEKLAAFGDIVVVAFNYRLGPLGFLNTGDDVVSGNAGLWDQHTAIKWVHDHIESFGGDPQKVTIAGESAGAASVMFQAIYPGNDGLFIRVIAQSGSANVPWAVVKDPASKAKKFAKALNCSVASSQVMVACLRAVNNITQIPSSLSLDFFTGVGIEWSPSVDDEFVTEERIDALNRPKSNTSIPCFKKLDLLMGTNGFEGGNVLTSYNLTYYKAFQNTSTSLDDVNSLKRHAISITLESIYGVKIAESILDDVMLQYSNQTTSDRNLIIQSLADIITDIAMLVPTSTALANHAFGNANSSTFQYEFNEENPIRQDDPWITGARHAEDLAYMFGSIYDEGVSSNLTSAELKAQWQLSSTMMTYWTNFIKTGDPNSPTRTVVLWEKYTEKDHKYLYLTSDKIEHGANLHNSRTLFWTKYFPKILKCAKERIAKKISKECSMTASATNINNSAALLLISVLMYIM